MSCTRRHTATAASTGACVRPTPSFRLVRYCSVQLAHTGPQGTNDAHDRRRFWLLFICFIFSERCFEDHEGLVEPLSAWSRYSENKLYFVLRPQKYVMFTDPQVRSSQCLTTRVKTTLTKPKHASLPLKLFYMWKKKKTSLKTINEEAKQLLIKVSTGIKSWQILYQSLISNFHTLRRVLEVLLWLFLISRAHCTWRKMGKGFGNLATLCSGPRASTLSLKAKQRYKTTKSHSDTSYLSPTLRACYQHPVQRDLANWHRSKRRGYGFRCFWLWRITSSSWGDVGTVK